MRCSCERDPQRFAPRRLRLSCPVCPAQLLEQPGSQCRDSTQHCAGGRHRDRPNDVARIVGESLPADRAEHEHHCPRADDVQRPHEICRGTGQ